MPLIAQLTRFRKGLPWERVGACPALETGVRANRQRPTSSYRGNPVPTVGRGTGVATPTEPPLPWERVGVRANQQRPTSTCRTPIRYPPWGRARARQPPTPSTLRRAGDTRHPRWGTGAARRPPTTADSTYTRTLTPHGHRVSPVRRRRGRKAEKNLVVPGKQRHPALRCGAGTHGGAQDGRGDRYKTPSPVGEGWSLPRARNGGEGQPTTPYLDLPDLYPVPTMGPFLIRRTGETRYPRWGAGRGAATTHPRPRMSYRTPLHCHPERSRGI